MLTIRYKRKFLRFAETYSSENLIDMENSDVQIDSWLLVPKDKIIPFKERPFQLIKVFKTLVIDLQKSENDIFLDFQKNTRYKINRSIREGVTFCIIENPNNRETQEFVEFFNEFAKYKKIEPCIPSKIKQLSNNKAFIITKAFQGDKVLCCHGYILENQRTIMLYSASLRGGKDSSAKNFIGRANRLLHWESMLAFKKLGCRWYDFCGLSQDPADKERQGINQFKKGFGGFEADELKRYRGYSLLGKIVIILSYFKWKNTPEYLSNLKDNKVKDTRSSP